MQSEVPFRNRTAGPQRRGQATGPSLQLLVSIRSARGCSPQHSRRAPALALREGPLSHCPPRPQCRRHRCVLPADHPPLVKGLGGLRVGVRFSQKLFKYECLGTIRLRFPITSFQSRMDVPTLAANPFLHTISDSDFSTGFLSFLLSSRPPPHPRGHLGPEARGPPR